jgi:hypothetical protein
VATWYIGLAVGNFQTLSYTQLLSVCSCLEKEKKKIDITRPLLVTVFSSWSDTAPASMCRFGAIFFGFLPHSKCLWSQTQHKPGQDSGQVSAWFPLMFIKAAWKRKVNCGESQYPGDIKAVPNCLFVLGGLLFFFFLNPGFTLPIPLGCLPPFLLSFSPFYLSCPHILRGLIPVTTLGLINLGKPFIVPSCWFRMQCGEIKNCQEGKWMSSSSIEGWQFAQARLPLAWLIIKGIRNLSPTPTWTLFFLFTKTSESRL